MYRGATSRVAGFQHRHVSAKIFDFCWCVYPYASPRLMCRVSGTSTPRKHPLKHHHRFTLLRHYPRFKKYR